MTAPRRQKMLAPHATWSAIVLTLALGVTCGCNQRPDSASVPPPGDNDIGQKLTESDGPAAGDQAAGTDQDAGPSASIADVADISDAGTSAPPQVGDAIAAPDTVDADAWPPFGDAGATGLPSDATPGDNPLTAAACLNVSLPQPDEPCSAEGKVRCTNHGALALGSVGGWMRCLRRNRVVCAKSPQDGSLRWELQACGTDNGCVGKWKQQLYCEENQRGVKCCPVKCYANKYSTIASVPWNPSPLHYCKPAEHGKKSCTSSAPNGFITTCGFRDEFPALEKYNSVIFSKCGHLCKDCLYWYSTVECPKHECIPPGYDKPPDPEKCSKGCEWPPVYGGKCIFGAGVEAHCAKDCKEVGAKGY